MPESTAAPPNRPVRRGEHGEASAHPTKMDAHQPTAAPHTTGSGAAAFQPDSRTGGRTPIIVGHRNRYHPHLSID